MYWLYDSNMREVDRQTYIREYDDIIGKLKRSRRDKLNPRDVRFWTTATFGKDEFYPCDQDPTAETDGLQFKYSRNIQPRTKKANMILGPIMHAIEKYLFHDSSDYAKPNPLNPEFVKCFSTQDKAKYLAQVFSGDSSVYGTDASAFECQMRNYVLLNSELPMLRAHLSTSEFENADYVITWLYHNIFSVASPTGQRGRLSNCDLPILDMRCSGDMMTSLGNGWNNLMFLKFCFSRYSNTHPSNIRVVVEGDDGLVASSAELEGIKDTFEKLGLSYKFDRYTNVQEAKFCQLTFNAGGELFREALGPILRSGWLPMKYRFANRNTRLALLRLRALSYIHQYPNAPIICVWAKRVLDLTAVAETRLKRLVQSESNMYLREQMDLTLHSNLPLDAGVVHEQMRLPYMHNYGVSIADQVGLERQLAAMCLGPFESPILERNCPRIWSFYALNYVVPDWRYNVPLQFSRPGRDLSRLVPSWPSEVWNV